CGDVLEILRMILLVIALIPPAHLIPIACPTVVPAWLFSSPSMILSEILKVPLLLAVVLPKIPNMDCAFVVTLLAIIFPPMRLFLMLTVVVAAKLPLKYIPHRFAAAVATVPFVLIPLI